MKRHPVPRSPFQRAPVRSLWALVAALFLTALAACGSATGDGDGPAVPADPLALKPPISTVQNLGEGFAFDYMSDTPVGSLWWSANIIYDATDHDAVFTHYQALFAAPEFTLTSEAQRVGEGSAAYDHAASGTNVTLKVERDGSRVRVDLDFELPGTFDPPVPGFSLTDFHGIEVTHFEGANVIDLEWAFAFVHGREGVESVFPAYDAQLRAMGWTATDLGDGEDLEWESEYVLDGVHLALKAGGDTWVEMEVNKLRFYQE